MNKTRKLVRRLPRKFKENVEVESGRLTEIKEKLAIVLPVIADTRSFVVDYLKLYATISVALNGGAIVAIFSTSTPKYFDALPYFTSCLFILMITILILFVVHTLPASHFTKFIFEKNYSIKTMINIIKYDSKISISVLFLSILGSLLFFAYGSSIGVSIAINERTLILIQ